MLAVFFAALRIAHAGPITGGPGNPPYTKLAVYQGVVSIVPGGPTDSLLEIGNAGRDIAGASQIFIRPHALNNGSANYIEFYKQNFSGTDKASLRIPGELCLGGVCNSSWPSGSGSSGPVVTRFIGNLAAAAAQARRFEVLRIGLDQVNWSLNTSVFIELRQKYWDAGGYKKYEVRAGYLDTSGSMRLVEAIGSNAANSTMDEVRVRLGPRVSVGGNIYYVPVYIDVDEYSNWDVTISHNMTEVAGSPTGASQLKIYDNPTGVNLADEEPGSPNSMFTESDVVTNSFTQRISPQNNTNEGGELQLTGAGANPMWFIDNYQTRLRIFNGSERFSIDGSGNVNLHTGQLCFGGDLSDCHGTWSDLGGGTQHWTDDSALADTASYATIGVTRSGTVANSSYIGLTQAGVSAWGIGIGDSGNSMIYGIASASPAKTIPNPLLKINRTTGNVHVVSGELCFGSGTTDCQNTWAGAGASNLDEVLAAGNTSNRNIALGGNTSNALIGITQTDINLDGLNVHQDTPGNTNSAIYAENAGGGYAGFFSSGASGTDLATGYFSNVRQSATAAAVMTNGALRVNFGGFNNTWNADDAVRIYNGTISGTGLRVKSSLLGLAASFESNVSIRGQTGVSGPSGSFPYTVGYIAALDVSTTANAYSYSVGIYSHPSNGPEGSVAYYTEVPSISPGIGPRGNGKGTFGFSASTVQASNAWAFYAQGKIGKKGSPTACTGLAEPFRTQCISNFSYEVPAIGAATGVAGSGYQTCTETCRSRALACVFGWTGGTGATAPSFRSCDAAAAGQCLCGEPL